MKMGDDIAQKQVVHVARIEHAFDHLPDILNVSPIVGELGCREGGEARHMPTTKDHCCMAPGDALPLEQGLADSPAVE
jgi:hypothetical protein